MPDRTNTGAHLRAGTAAAGAYALEITPESAGWGFSGLRILELAPGGTHALGTGEDEVVVLPLEGGCTVAVDGETFALEGRDGVFSGITDFLYAPRDSRVEVASDGGGRFALTSSRADRRLEARHVPAEDIAVESRGAGQASPAGGMTVAPGPATSQRWLPRPHDWWGL